ncbi:hypothetical protein CIB48_g462 [Xylaria polymorpha]|nr:hypothetical protein CIB48_g462 [Xylaria polymorpha]
MTDSGYSLIHRSSGTPPSNGITPLPVDVNVNSSKINVSSPCCIPPDPDCATIPNTATPLPSRPDSSTFAADETRKMVKTFKFLSRELEDAILLKNALRPSGT